MKPEEAIEIIESTKELYKPAVVEEAFDMEIEALKEIQQYREIGTVKECREAVEKQKPKEYESNRTEWKTKFMSKFIQSLAEYPHF